MAIPDLLVAAAWWAVAALAAYVEVPAHLAPLIGDNASLAIVYLIWVGIALVLLGLVRSIHAQAPLRDQIKAKGPPA